MMLKGPLRLALLYIVPLLVDSGHHEPAMMPLAVQGENTPLLSISLSSDWQLLGPFQIGTREAAWGADPLEIFGGFRNLQFDPEAQFRSSLGSNGTVKWSELVAEDAQSNMSGISAMLNVKFGDAGLPLQGVYGWAALQYQAWARGKFYFAEEGSGLPIIIYTQSILEFWIDDVHYFGGDFYSSRKAPPVIRLEPGVHTIDLRLVYDVRVMGGSGEAAYVIGLELAGDTLELASEGIAMADIVNGSLASALASVSIRNSRSHDIEVLSIESSYDSATAVMRNTGVVVTAGQTRPLLFNISLNDSDALSVRIRIKYKEVNIASDPSFVEVSQLLNRRSIHDPHKITYLHPGSIVSYAILRAPSENAIRDAKKGTNFPIFLGLHGAGVEADNDLVAHSLDPVPDLQAWVLFPTGVTPWSGDDWHNWGFADVEAAVNYIPKWIEAVGWRGPGVDLDRWLVAGHSNGGQGTWYALTHRPSKVSAAAPISGYSSIQNYVPYVLWQHMDSQRATIRDGALNSYRHELLMENCKGIPILQQHGELDDNVPTYHSRLLSQLLLQANGSSQYHELPGKGHWFDGVMTTPHLVEFYNKQLESGRHDLNLRSFSVVVGTPADMGPKGGIRPNQLETPGQYGKIDVKFDETAVSHSLTTSNILSLEVDDRYLLAKSFSIDGQAVALSRRYGEHGNIELWRSSSGQWKMEIKKPSISLRSGRQLGPMDAILRTSGQFTIRYQQSEAAAIALQISRNLFQYFSADSAIVQSSAQAETSPGNVVTVAISGSVPRGALPHFPIVLSASGLSIRESGGRVREYGGEGGLSAIFLQPLPDERLELVVWGVDKDSLVDAARLVPMLTGVGQPDFVVLRRDSRWKGVEGAVAMGFFDHEWNVTTTAVLG